MKNFGSVFGFDWLENSVFIGEKIGREEEKLRVQTSLQLYSFFGLSYNQSGFVFGMS